MIHICSMDLEGGIVDVLYRISLNLMLQLLDILQDQNTVMLTSATVTMHDVCTATGIKKCIFGSIFICI